MPELPEIYHLSEQMDRELTGKRVLGVEVRQPKCLNRPVDEFTEIMVGRTVQGATSRGKWAMLRLDGEAWFMLSLGMGGDAILHPVGQALPDKYQVRLDFHDGSVLTLAFWWFGYAHALREGELAAHRMTAELGPTPLRDADLTRERFIALLAGRRGGVKSWLLNQRNIAGIGNVYVQDMLFRARLHPNRGLQTLSDAERSALYDAMMTTLRQATDLGGLAYEKDLHGQEGGFKDFLVGYREGEPCPVCGTTIVKIKTGSTASYICPNDQRE